MAPPPSSACSAHCPSPHCEHHVVWASRPIRHLTQTCSHSAHTHTHKAITLPFKGPLHSGDRSSPPLPFHPSGFSNKRARPRRHRIVGESRQPSGHMLSQCPPPRSLSPSSRTLTPTSSFLVCGCDTGGETTDGLLFIWSLSLSWFLSF